MEVLARYGTPEQQARWLTPLLAGEIRSCFAMTEPAVASSDATNIEASIERRGDEYVVNGRKWYTTNATDPRCKVSIFMGKNRPPEPGPTSAAVDDSDPHGYARRRSRAAASGVRVLWPFLTRRRRCCSAMCTCPLRTFSSAEGRGFEIAQGVLARVGFTTACG